MWWNKVKAKITKIETIKLVMFPIFNQRNPNIS